MNETVKNTEKRELKTSRLSLEKLDALMAKLGPYQEMTALECQQMTANKVNDISLSDLIIKMRNEGL